MDQQSDKELVALCRRSDRNAYGSLVRRYAGRVFGLCYGIVGRPQDAEDLAQETFVRGLDRLHSIRDGEQFYSWLSQIGRNLCVDFIRRRKRMEENFAECLDTGSAQSRVNHGYSKLMDVIERLPEQLRVPLLDYYIGGETTGEIARSLGITQATVHTRLSRARKELRRLLAGKEVTG